MITLDPSTFDLVTSIAAAVFFAVLAYLRSKYAAVGDKYLTEIAKLLAASKADEALYPQLAPLNAKLQLAYNDVEALWTGSSEFTTWAGLMKAVGDFFAVYTECAKIKAIMAPTAPAAATAAVAAPAAPVTAVAAPVVAAPVAAATATPPAATGQ